MKKNLIIFANSIRRLPTIFYFFALQFISVSAYADTDHPLKTGIPINRNIYNVHMTVFWICAGISIIAFIILLLALFLHRRSQQNKSSHFHKYPILEIIWFIIPFISFILMAIPATHILFHPNTSIQMKSTRQNQTGGQVE